MQLIVTSPRSVVTVLPILDASGNLSGSAGVKLDAVLNEMKHSLISCLFLKLRKIVRMKNVPNELAILLLNSCMMSFRLAGNVRGLASGGVLALRLPGRSSR